MVCAQMVYQESRKEEVIYMSKYHAGTRPYRRTAPVYRYSVYLRATDMPVCISGTARECAAAMKITLGSLHTIYTKLRNGNRRRTSKWEIFKDEPDDED